MSERFVNFNRLIFKNMIGNKALKERIAQLEAENTLLRENEIKVQQAKELYLKIFEDFPALIWRAGLDKKCDHFNKTWLEFTGRTMEQEVGNGWTEGVHPDDFDRCVATYVEAFDRREAFFMEYRLKNAAGEYRWIRDFGRPFYDFDESFQGYIGSCYDISKSKLNEQQLEGLNNSLSKLVSILAHDLRSPISTIIGLSDILMLDADNHNQEMLNTLHKNIHLVSTHTLDYLDELLIWGQTLEGGISLSDELICCKDVCQDVLNEFAERAKMKQIKMTLEGDDSTQFSTDSHILKTILRNLISNALKFTHVEGTIILRFAMLETCVRIEVQDDGVGMTPEQAEALWKEPINETTRGTQQEKGGGFGLNICKSLIEKVKGTIRVVSRVNEGSTFILEFPV